MAQRQFRSDDTSIWSDGYGNGSDGAMHVTTNQNFSAWWALTNCTGSASATTLSVGSSSGFSTGNLILIHQTQGSGAGNWELNKISNITGFALQYPLINTYVSGAQVLRLGQTSSVTIDSGVTLSADGWNGSTGGIVALLCNGVITVTGGISAVGLGFRGGAGHKFSTNGQQGESEAGVGGNSKSANGTGGGGSLQDDITGGGGGHTNAGDGAVDNGGAGGNAGSDNVGLTIMQFGGAGGGGEANSSSSAGGGGTGGYGTGVILLIGRTITVTGSVNATGGNGANGAGSNNVSGGGGGAGGSVLLKGQVITLGASLITADKGAAGTNTSGSSGSSKRNGSVGRIHADYGLSIAGTTTPTIDTTKDVSLNDTGGAFIFNFL